MKSKFLFAAGLCLFMMAALFAFPLAAFSEKRGFTLRDFNAMEPYDAVLHVRILSSKVHEFKFGEELLVCGVSHTAKVLEKVVESKSIESEVIDFHSNGLDVSANAEYVVFVERHEIDYVKGYQSRALFGGNLWENRDDLASINSDKRFWACREELPLDYVGLRYEFYWSPLSASVTHLWLEYDYFRAPTLPSGVKTQKAQCDDRPQTDDGEVTSCDLIGEPALIHWPSFREYLRERWSHGVQ